MRPSLLLAASPAAPISFSKQLLSHRHSLLASPVRASAASIGTSQTARVDPSRHQVQPLASPLTASRTAGRHMQADFAAALGEFRQLQTLLAPWLLARRNALLASSSTTGAALPAPSAQALQLQRDMDAADALLLAAEPDSSSISSLSEILPAPVSIAVEVALSGPVLAEKLEQHRLLRQWLLLESVQLRKRVEGSVAASSRARPGGVTNSAPLVNVCLSPPCSCPIDMNKRVQDV